MPPGPHGPDAQVHVLAGERAEDVEGDPAEAHVGRRGPATPLDRVDQQVLRQVPSPEMLAIARALERMQTLLVRARA